MKFGKVVLFAVFGMIFLIGNCADVFAQDQKPKQIKILNNYGSIPFNDGETVISEVKFLGLDEDSEENDGAIGKPLPENEFLNNLKLNQKTINPGDKFYGSKVAKIVKDLRDWVSSKGYHDAEIEAFGEHLPNNRMRLIFSVKRGPMFIVSEIRFDGNIIFSNAELVGIMKKCLGDKKIFDALHYEYCAQKHVRGLMQSKGYFKARIIDISPRLVSNSYVVEISINESVRFLLGNIEFEGATVFSKKELAEILGLKKGDVADGRHLQEFVYEDLKRAYANQGYVLFDGEFDPVFIDPQTEGADGIVNIKINIYEGQQFKVFKIKFVGVDEEEANQLKENFPLQEGDIYNHSKLEEGIQKINDLKEFYPIDFDQDVEIRANEEEDAVLTITNKEEDAVLPILKRNVEIRTNELRIFINIRKLTADEQTNNRELLKRRP